MLEIVDMVDILVTRLSYWFMMAMVVMLDMVEIEDMMGHMLGVGIVQQNQLIYFMPKTYFFRFQSVISNKHVCAPLPVFNTKVMDNDVGIFMSQHNSRSKQNDIQHGIHIYLVLCSKLFSIQIGQ